ncbi:MAG: sodium-dependent transporter [Sandaracinaceae bacterium]
MVSADAKPREQWSSRLGFTLAAVGSAVGLGNMWRFPYQTSEAGGAAFVLLYLVMTALIGVPIMLAELTVGRGAGKSPIQALRHFGGRGWGALGFVFIAAGAIILGYYSVVAGWTARYAVEIAAFGPPQDPAGHFGALAFGNGALAWHLAFMALTAVIVAQGIKGGIERASLVLMPVLAFLVSGLAIYASTLDGAMAGYAYYLNVDVRKVVDLGTLAKAAGQAFFSLSLGMGAILTYASYLSRDDNLPAQALIISLADFGIAFLAGLLVFPLLFAFDLQGEATGGLGTLFITLPRAFQTLGVLGRVLGCLFFVALAVGALTSTISLLEVVVSSGVDALGWPRRRVAWSAALLIALVGTPAAYSGAYLDFMDAVAGNLLLVIGGLLLAVLVGWVMKDPEGEVRAGAPRASWVFAWRGILRFVVPAILVLVLYDAFGEVRDKAAALLGGGG